MKDEINKVRENLHREIGSKKNNYEEIIRISEELDKLIVEYSLEEEKKIK